MRRLTAFLKLFSKFHEKVFVKVYLINKLQGSCLAVWLSAVWLPVCLAAWLASGVAVM